MVLLRVAKMLDVNQPTQVDAQPGIQVQHCKDHGDSHAGSCKDCGSQGAVGQIAIHLSLALEVLPETIMKEILAALVFSSVVFCEKTCLRKDGLACTYPRMMQGFKVSPNMQIEVIKTV